ncbi:MAG: flavin reductase [Rikenellaceae bacterium]
MENYKIVEPAKLDDNMIKLIGKEWMLISAGDSDKFNTMTANWGSIGFYANKPIATIFVRPERYTFDFVEESDCFTLSFFGDSQREALALLGKVSGRDCDKVAEAGLSPIFTEKGNPAFSQARMVLECRKIYGHNMSKDDFIDQEIFSNCYTRGGVHKMYMAVIENCYVRE